MKTNAPENMVKSVRVFFNVKDKQWAGKHETASETSGATRMLTLVTRRQRYCC